MAYVYILTWKKEAKKKRQEAHNSKKDIDLSQAMIDEAFARCAKTMKSATVPHI